ncbi:MAG: HAD family hydrolase [Tannerella sp.]|jgi:phosphoglycolate phosphatase|nr:HAD family hydrolase [Tannerella sp.]
MSAKRLIIFDLDGTLLNTITDLAHATNYALLQLGFPYHNVEEYKYFVGNGMLRLFERALPENERNEANFLAMRKHFLPFYERHNSVFTKPYEGIYELLTNLQSAGLKFAVASNKYHKATEELIRRYFPHIDFVAVFGQREGIPVKPSPAIVFEILQKAGIAAKETLYVGDSGVDMQTALNAGIDSVGVTWGFRPRAELEKHGAKYIIDTPSKLQKYVTPNF